MQIKPFLAVLAVIKGTAGVAVAVPITTDFETDQSASFVVITTTADANANFTYNSSTHVQDGGDPLVIPPAPSGASTNNVLRLNANISDPTGVDAVAVYPDATGLGSSWEMTWDVWQNYNGPATGGSGSSQFFMFGATNATSVAPLMGTAAGDGFWFGMCGEGGFATDYRFYDGTGSIVNNNAGALWHGGAHYNNTAQEWQDFFPTPPFETAGAMGKAWMTVRLSVVGTNATVAIKKVGDVFVDVATATIPATANKPFVGYSDGNATLPSPASLSNSQFTLIDNLSLDNGTTDVRDWNLY